MVLYGLHLYFNFGKIRFINDGFITKKRSINVRRQENEKTKSFFFVTGSKADIKITFVGLFLVRRP